MPVSLEQAYHLGPHSYWYPSSGLIAWGLIHAMIPRVGSSLFFFSNLMSIVVNPMQDLSYKLNSTPDPRPHAYKPPWIFTASLMALRPQ